MLGIHGKMVVVVISQNNSYHVSRTDGKVQELKRELFAATGVSLCLGWQVIF